MKGDLKEIASIINECFYYFNRLLYLVNKLYSIDGSRVSAPARTNSEREEWNRARIIFENKCKFLHLKSKPFFTQLVFDLNHLLRFNLFDGFQQSLTGGKFTRLKDGVNEDVDNLKRAIIFFRDAIAHPEHYPDKPSPRALPGSPPIYTNMYLYLFQNQDTTDFYFQIAEVKVLFKADILKGLNNLKEWCLKKDTKKQLENFRWLKSC